MVMFVMTECTLNQILTNYFPSKEREKNQTQFLSTINKTTKQENKVMLKQSNTLTAKCNFPLVILQRCSDG